MAETIKNIGLGNSAPEQFQQYKSLGYKSVDNGDYQVEGIFRNNHRRELSHDEVLEAYGHGSTITQQPIEATWRNNTSDMPITVVGSYGTVAGGQEFMKIEGTTSGIPRTEISWPKLEEAEPSAEEQVLKTQLADLAERMRLMEARFESLIQRNAELESLITEKDEKIAELQSQLQTSPESATPLVTEVTETTVSEVPIVEEAIVTSTPPEKEVIDTAPVAVVAERETVSERTQERRRPARRMLGIIAAAGALAATGLGIYNLHEIEELEHHQPVAELVQPKPDADSNEHAELSSLASGYHTDFYNQTDPTHRLTGVELPKNLKLILADDGRKIIDAQGRVIINKVQWDRQGKLSRATMSSLKQSNYKLVSGKLGNRYKSIVIN